MGTNKLTHTLKLYFNESGALQKMNETSYLPGNSLGLVRLSHCAEVFDDDTRFSVKEDEDFLGLLFNMGNDLEYTIGEQKTTLYTLHYNLIYIPAGLPVPYSIAKGRYATFCFEFTKSYLVQWAEKFPALQNFLANVENNIPAQFTTSPLIATSRMMSIIESILHYPGSGMTSDIFFISRTYDIVWECLTAITSNSDPRKKYSDAAKIQLAHDYLMQDLKRDWSLNLLADTIDMEPSKLNRRFKRIYGKYVKQYLTDLRMKRALDLLADESIPIKDIGKAVGYKNKSSFTYAFRKKFNYPPGQLRA